jgi:hypothetical protein
MTTNLVFQARTKHIEADYYFVREHVASKLLQIRLISSGDQITDAFTKALPIRKMIEFRYNLNLGNCGWEGGVTCLV